MVITFYQTGPNGLFILYQVFNLILQSAKIFCKKNNIYAIATWILNILIISILILLGNVLNSVKLIELAQKFAFIPATLLILFEAIGLFVWIGSKNINYHYLINKVASVTFGIYLISDNSYVRDWLWNTVLHMNTMIKRNPILIIGYTIRDCKIVCVRMNDSLNLFL